jgi:hypothetical protein
MVAKMGRKWLFHGVLYCNQFTNILIGVKIYLDVRNYFLVLSPQGIG